MGDYDERGNYNTELITLTINSLIGDSVRMQKVLEDIIKENIEFLPQYK
ncbi:hypothetical protein [Oceanirhabdus seepicola]|uniref:Uncharacterized protein n=1 Tax=Oceanirhabdus seepicola TaxID=2828781 RepID=A0A9J6NY92_9CLOT|nr:hypothetical protein [Oceanirhabdus seepicola]MCM1989410.1 hypothetical protein [Oceanirhabdus seepicola]